MPNLDYANPLHSFTTGNLSYTATKECYLVGTMNAASSTGQIQINNTYILNSSTSGTSWSGILKLNSGDVVEVNRAVDQLHVFDVLAN